MLMFVRRGLGIGWGDCLPLQTTGAALVYNVGNAVMHRRTNFSNSKINGLHLVFETDAPADLPKRYRVVPHLPSCAAVPFLFVPTRNTACGILLFSSLSQWVHVC